MPNWAMGDVSITGTRTEVLAFSDRFIADDAESTVPGKKYFARSFVDIPRKTLHGDIEDFFRHAAEDEERTMSLLVTFAWSAMSCLIDGYPQHNTKDCITLAEACVEDHVSVEIHTSETGMCFEEEITCDKSGFITNVERDLQRFVCPECGESSWLASFEDPDDYECWECSHEGLVPPSQEETK